MAVEYVHPMIFSEFYRAREINSSDGSPSTRQQIDEAVSRGQSELWRALIGEGASRVLFISAGRGLHGGLFKPASGEVYIYELFHCCLDAIQTGPGVTLVDKAALCGSDLAGTFDLIIMSNGFERMPNPKYRLSWCSHLLKEGGHLAMELPNMEFKQVEVGRFDQEEINYFSPQALGNLISIQGSFSILESQMGKHPDGRDSIRAVLKNEHRLEALLDDEVPLGEIMHMLGKMSFSCFLHKTKYSRPLPEGSEWTGLNDDNSAQPIAFSVD